MGGLGKLGRRPGEHIYVVSKTENLCTFTPLEYLFLEEVQYIHLSTASFNTSILI